MKIVTIIGDSLSMARSEYGITTKTSYAYLLNELLGTDYLVCNKAKRTNTIVEQTSRQCIYDDVLTTDSTYFIIQLGIVDCAPRLFSIIQSKILKYIKPKFLRDLIINFKSNHRYFFTKSFPKVFVPIDLFTEKYNYLLDTILKETNVKKIIIINIADTNENNKQRSFGFEKNINSYNKVISDLALKYKNSVHLIDMHKIVHENKIYLLEDGIHISKELHKILAELISEEINKCVN